MAKAERAKSDEGTFFTSAFSTFAVDNVAAAKKFYGETLGLDVNDEMEGLSINIPEGPALFIYPKEDHEPAVFTVFNFKVDDIDVAVEDLTSRGIEFLQYKEPIETDEKGIFRGDKEGKGPAIAWFEDPAGNILSVIQE